MSLTPRGNLENAMIFLDKMAHPSAPRSLESILAEIPTITPNSLSKPFNLAELKSAIEKLKIKAAAGPDLIPAVAIQNLPENILHYLLRLFNSFKENQNIPPIWMTYYVVLIPKNSGSDFRPIAISSAFAKIFEGLIKTRL